MNSHRRIIIITLLIGIILGSLLAKVLEIKIGINPDVKRILRPHRPSEENRRIKEKDTLELCYFEQKADLGKLERGKIDIERSQEQASEGKYSLKCIFSDGGGSISFYGTLPRDWSGYDYLKFDVYSEEEDIPLSLFVADTKNISYRDRYNKERIRLKKGWNNIEVPISEIDRKLKLDEVNHLLLFLWKVKGEHVLYFDNIRLTSGKISDNAPLNNPIRIAIYPAKEKIEVSRLLYGSNLCAKMESDHYVWTFAQDIGITCFRFPGGGSPGWHWKTTSADFNKKFQNMPLGRIDYLVKFCEKSNTKLIMQVNIESGTPQEAAEFVEYMNKIANFRVDYWELGNEPYGNWDRAFTTPENYVETIREYSLAMKAVDPAIKIGASWNGRDKWDYTIIRGAADYIDFVSYHWYPNHISGTHKYEGRIHPTPEEVMANSLAIPDIVRRFNKIIEEETPHRKGKIEMTFLEWDGAWDAPPYDPLPYEQNIIQWSLANAIFYADSLGLFAENGVTVATHYDFQECPFGLIRGYNAAVVEGGEKWDTETIRPKAFAIKLFSKHFGDILLESKVENSPYYHKTEDWWPGSYSGEVPYISCYASKFSDGKKLGIILVNKHSEQDFKLNFSIDEAIKVTDVCNIWILTGPNIMSQNDSSPRMVKIEELSPIRISSQFEYTIPAHSVVAMEIGLL